MCVGFSWIVDWNRNCKNNPNWSSTGEKWCVFKRAAQAFCGPNTPSCLPWQVRSMFQTKNQNSSPHLFIFLMSVPVYSALMTKKGLKEPSDMKVLINEVSAPESKDQTVRRENICSCVLSCFHGMPLHTYCNFREHTHTQCAQVCRQCQILICL